MLKFHPFAVSRRDGWGISLTVGYNRACSCPPTPRPTTAACARSSKLNYTSSVCSDSCNLKRKVVRLGVTGNSRWRTCCTALSYVHSLQMQPDHCTSDVQTWTLVHVRCWTQVRIALKMVGLVTVLNYRVSLKILSRFNCIYLRNYITNIALFGVAEFGRLVTVCCP